MRAGEGAGVAGVSVRNATGRDPPYNSPVTSTTLRTLLHSLVDYAGLFPPAALDMHQAVHEYAHHRAGDHAWMLGHFIVPVSRLEEFATSHSALGPSPVGDVWQLPDDHYIFGLDNLGRDILSRLIYGARTTLLVSSAATIISFSLGIILSFTAAVSRGIIDTVFSRFNDLMMSIPTLIFALVVLAVLPQNIVVLILVMAILDSTRVYRLGRAVALDVAVMEFVEAAKLRGEGKLWIIFREILPNTLSPLLAEFGLRFAFSILFLSTLSFLGLGIQPPAADWGGMVKDNKDGIIFGISAALVPGTAIAVLAVCVNLVVDWLLKRTSSLKGGRGDA